MKKDRGTISVIIPVWKESAALDTLLAFLENSSEVFEVIVSFADGTDAAMKAAEEKGAKCIRADVPNRGRQMDLGAREATGDWLLFQHADTYLTAAHLRSLTTVDFCSPILGGAFYRQFDERHPWLRWLAPIERWHNRSFGALYGDQSIFVRRTVFREMGGFRGLPLMEDVDFTLRLRRRGPLCLLSPAIGSSPRKHLAQGPWKTTCRHALFLLLYHLGVSPERLHARYYARGASGLQDATDYGKENASALEPYPLKKQNGHHRQDK